MKQRALEGFLQFCQKRCVRLGWFPSEGKTKGVNHSWINTATYLDISENTSLDRIFWSIEEFEEFHRDFAMKNPNIASGTVRSEDLRRLLLDGWSISEYLEAVGSTSS